MWKAGKYPVFTAMPQLHDAVTGDSKLTAPILVIGIGNESRGDDALGPFLLRRLAAMDWRDCEFLEVYQLQIEHALDLQGRNLVLFLDAGIQTSAPFSCETILPDSSDSPFSHALTPQALLGVCKRLGFSLPEAQVICVRGERFELGAPLSGAAETALEAACLCAVSILKIRQNLLA